MSGDAREAAEVREMMMENASQRGRYPLIATSTRNVPTGGFAIAANFAGEQLFFKN